MKKVITYGTFDIFHEGHINILKKSKALGDYLIVGVTGEEYDQNRGKLNVKQGLLERVENVKKSGLADEIIIEYRSGQKISDIKKYNIDYFAIGSDWEGKFDYLNEYCKVTYLPRTQGISSTMIRNQGNGILNIGVIGTGRIANRFILESKYVSGVNVLGVCGRTEKNIQSFKKKYGLDFGTTDLKNTLKKVDAIYIATPHNTHYEIAKEALEQGKHVLCEKPSTLKYKQLEEILSIANSKGLVFLEGIKTLFTPGFIRLIEIAKSGMIGEIKDVDCTFTKLMNDGGGREFDPNQFGGSLNELGSYVLSGIIRLLGSPDDASFFSYKNKNDIDLYTKIICNYSNKIATGNIGLGVKKEGNMVISGTQGYIYVPSPWWLTQEFEVCYEDRNKNQKFFYEFQGDGLRYEIAEFLNLINNKQQESWKYTQKNMLDVSKIISNFNKKN